MRAIIGFDIVIVKLDNHIFRIRKYYDWDHSPACPHLSLDRINK